MPAFDETDKQIKYRIQDPGLFEPDSFKSKSIGEGLSLIVGKKKGATETEAQSVAFEKPAWDLAKATKWIEEHKKDLTLKYDLDTFEIDDVEIFATGKWNGDNYNIKDLDDMVDTFNETKGQVQPFLKLGHDEEQSLLRSSQLPAAGWITELRREGSKLLAKFSGVPKTIFELIKAGAYKTVSSEIFWNIQIMGKKFRRMLKGVALLGAELRAVTDLKDIMALYQSRPFENTSNETRSYKIDQTEFTREDEMEKVAELEKTLSDVNEQLKIAKEEIKTHKEKDGTKAVEIEKLSSSVKEMSSQLEGFKSENIQMKASATADKLLMDKKITPAQKDALVSLLSNPKNGKYSFNEKEYGTISDAIIAFLQAAPAHVIPTEAESEQGKKHSADLDTKVREYMEKNKVDYKSALLKVSTDSKGA